MNRFIEIFTEKKYSVFLTKRYLKKEQSKSRYSDLISHCSNTNDRNPRHEDFTKDSAFRSPVSLCTHFLVPMVAHVHESVGTPHWSQTKPKPCQFISGSSTDYSGGTKFSLPWLGGCLPRGLPWAQLFSFAYLLVCLFGGWFASWLDWLFVVALGFPLARVVQDDCWLLL